MDPHERNQQQAERAILAQEFEKKTEEERNQWRAAQNNIISNRGTLDDISFMRKWYAGFPWHLKVWTRKECLAKIFL